MGEVLMSPSFVLSVVMIVGFVVVRVVISNIQFKRKQKSYLMIVKHGGQEFRSLCVLEVVLKQKVDSIRRLLGRFGRRVLILLTARQNTVCLVKPLPKSFQAK